MRPSPSRGGRGPPLLLLLLPGLGRERKGPGRTRSEESLQTRRYRRRGASLCALRSGLIFAARPAGCDWPSATNRRQIGDESYQSSPKYQSSGGVHRAHADAKSRCCLHHDESSPFRAPLRLRHSSPRSFHSCVFSTPSPSSCRTCMFTSFFHTVYTRVSRH